MRDNQFHMYHAVGKSVEQDRRYFVQAQIQLPDSTTWSPGTAGDISLQIQRLTEKMLNAIQSADDHTADFNHIFIDCEGLPRLVPGDLERALGDLSKLFAPRLLKCCIGEIELRFAHQNAAANKDGNESRAVLSLKFGSFYQAKMLSVPPDQQTREQLLFHDDNCGGNDIHSQFGISPQPYPVRTRNDFKRQKAHSMDTQYAYDFPAMFLLAIHEAWDPTLANDPDPTFFRPNYNEYLTCRELVLNCGGNLEQVDREHGQNDIGMVGWMITAKTVELRGHDRQFVIVANDVTFKSGPFGPKEENFFLQCSVLARTKGLTLIYISANLGARINAAELLFPYFSVAWKDSQDPKAGFEYLYLTPETKRFLDGEQSSDAYTEEIITEDGEVRHRITTIIGAEKGLGVECLRGSGEICAATSSAYEQIFTITLVTGRSVGVGAYLARLGQRIIQVEDAPLVLTGAQAINAVLGRPVYSSNLQLGGPEIMCQNGVTHQTAADDLDGVRKILQWMSCVPRKANLTEVIRPAALDTWDRDIIYLPPAQTQYDIRWAIAGKLDDTGEFHAGLFDRGSFHETLSGWARGSYIVDSLVKYKYPIFIYCPPSGEIRGGGWVIVDTALNPAYMETYADETARGNVLEPEALVSIKYRKDQQLKTMARLDPAYRELVQKLKDSKDLPREEVIEQKTRMIAREELLLPIYYQITTRFAELQDTPMRLETIGVIQRRLKWAQARRFFYWRLRRRLNEEVVLKRVIAANTPSHESENVTLDERRRSALDNLERWSGIADYKHADREVSSWCEDNMDAIDAKVEHLRSEHRDRAFAALLTDDRSRVVERLEKAIKSLSATDKGLLSSLTQ